MPSICHTYISLYATPDNETHFREVQVQFDLVEDFAPPAPPVFVGGMYSTRSAFFLAFPPQWGTLDLKREIWHATPARQFATVLQGNLVIYASDGATLDMEPGDTLLVEDLMPAKGHITMNTSTEEPCVIKMVQW